MNIETINKWLDEEYGCSYTRLEELHDFYFEKYCDLQKENKQLKNNWNKLKEWAKYERKVAVSMQNGYGTSLCDCMVNKMLELEKSDSNE